MPSFHAPLVSDDTRNSPTSHHPTTAAITSSLHCIYRQQEIAGIVGQNNKTLQIKPSYRRCAAPDVTAGRDAPVHLCANHQPVILHIQSPRSAAALYHANLNHSRVLLCSIFRVFFSFPIWPAFVSPKPHNSDLPTSDQQFLSRSIAFYKTGWHNTVLSLRSCSFSSRHPKLSDRSEVRPIRQWFSTSPPPPTLPLAQPLTRFHDVAFLRFSSLLFSTHKLASLITARCRCIEDYYRGQKKQ